MLKDQISILCIRTVICCQVWNVHPVKQWGLSSVLEKDIARESFISSV